MVGKTNDDTTKNDTTPTPELTASERAYHRRLFQQMQLAQASWQMWCAHLNDFYHLTPHDTINEDGFVRGTPPTAATSPPPSEE